MTVHLEASDSGSAVETLSYRAAGAAPRTVAGPAADVRIDAEGMTVLRFSATDRAGNESPAREVTVRLDTVAPAIDVRRPGLDAVLSPADTLDFVATDTTSGLASVTAELDDRPAAAGDPVRGDGPHRLEVDATDLAGNRATASRTFSVDGPDAPPPYHDVAGNDPPLPHAGGPEYEAHVGRPVTLDGSRSSDADRDPLTYRWDLGDGHVAGGVAPSHTYAEEGRYLVRLVVNDGKQDSLPGAGGFALVHVMANDPPDCSPARGEPAELWPPNHELVKVRLGGVTDPDGDPVTLAIRSVRQDEPLNGLGDGDTAPDAQWSSRPQDVLLRAERSGGGDGRVYRISFDAADGRGGACNGLVRVAVPHDPSRPAVDSRLDVDSFGG